MLCVAFTYAGIRDSLDESDCSRTGDVEYLNNNGKRGDGLGGEGQSRCKLSVIRGREKSGFLGGVAGLRREATKKTVVNRIGIKARD